ncbi:MAG TPA: hypothetical protein VFM63_00315 [Pyrinomonadaceae bacterium]|nr:hypothetical protein [Pyrinomonadaceae bacterium]
MSSIFPQTPEPSQPYAGRMVAGIAVGVVTAAAFGLGGYYLVAVMDNGMGGALFILLPVATGCATALVARGKAIIFASLVIAALMCTTILLVMDQEGWVCVLMSAPLIAAGLALGALLGWALTLLIKRSRRGNLATFLMLGALPLFLMGASRAERQSQTAPRVETIANTLVTDASREVVWEQLKMFDRIEGSKGLLMTIGLPVPVSCSMSGEGVGATRICYFEEGRIEERVTEWNPPSTMKFEIVAFDVPGRPWLSFKDASYELTTEGGKTMVTRKTTILSILGPAWYWRPLEKIGVETEHEYLFEEVKRKIEVAK